MIIMPMVYVSDNAERLLKDLMEHLDKNKTAPSRVLKADVIQAALEEYSKKVGLKVK